MTVAAFRPLCPVIVGCEGINEPRCELQLLPMYKDASRNAAGNGGLEYAPGTWIKPHATPANGYVACESGVASASHVIKAIFDQYGNLLPFQYVAASDTTQYYVLAMPIGGLIFYMTEDADTTPITDANSGVTPIYADIVVAAMADTTQGVARLAGSVTPNIKIDSNTVNATSNNLLVQLLGLAPIADQPVYSSTSLASPRVFKVRVKASSLDAAQGATASQ